MRAHLVAMFLIASLPPAGAADLDVQRAPHATAPAVVRSPAAPAPASEMPASTPAEPSIFNFGTTDKTCSAWTDGCRTCQRQGEGAAQCSNVGIACQATEIRCTQR